MSCRNFFGDKKNGNKAAATTGSIQSFFGDKKDKKDTDNNNEAEATETAGKTYQLQHAFLFFS